MSRALLLAVASASLGACFDNPELQAQMALLEQENTTLKGENSRLDREADALSAKVRGLEDQIRRLKRREALARLGIDDDDTMAVLFETNRGRVACTLFPRESPQTVLNFVQLAEGSKAWEDPDSGAQTQRPLYHGTLFHRVMPGFMIQGGDPEGTGRGGPGYTFEDETDNGLTFDKPGKLAMANRGADTNGSQFFITDRATPHHLDGKHTIFGQCENLEVVQAIAETARDSRDRPVQPVIVEQVRIFRTRR